MYSQQVNQSRKENNMENGGGGGIESIIPLCERWSVYFKQKTKYFLKLK